MSLTPTVLFDQYIEINGVAISDHANKIELNVTVEDLETTAFGKRAKTRVGGLEDGTVAVTLFNDFSAGNLDSMMWTLKGQVVPFLTRPTSAAVGPTNPQHAGFILINGWKPVSGDVGKVTMADMTFPTSDVVTRSTS